MNKKTFLFLFLTILMVVSLSFSQEKLILLKLKKAYKFVEYREYEKSLNYLYDAIMEIKNSEPLGIKEMVFIEKDMGYSNYIKKDILNNTLKAGEPLYLYIEPKGYTIKKTKNGYFIWVSEDTIISDKKTGKILFKRENWVTMKKSFPYPTIPFYITNRISDIPKGDYIFTIIIKDNLSGKKLKKSIPFYVR